MWVNKGAYFSPTLSKTTVITALEPLKCVYMYVHAPHLNCTYLIWFWLDSCCCVIVSTMNQCSCLRNIEKMFVNIIQLTSEKK